MKTNKIVRKVLAIEPYLSKVAYGLLNEKSDVEDAVSETTLTILQKFDQLKDQAYFKTWATRICINECYAILRKNKKYVELDETSLIDSNNNYLNLYDALDSLPTQLKTIVVLKYISGYTFKEISEIVDSSTTSVQRQNKEALALLRVELEDEE